jgi:hypothetical protein
LSFSKAARTVLKLTSRLAATMKTVLGVGAKPEGGM